LVELIDVLYGVFIFFSSRRRNTMSKRDWSSDVCSSDLGHGPDVPAQGGGKADHQGIGQSRVVGAEHRTSLRDILPPNGADGMDQIGRASCRERVERAVGWG